MLNTIRILTNRRNDNDCFTGSSAAFAIQFCLHLLDGFSFRFIFVVNAIEKTSSHDV